MKIKEKMIMLAAVMAIGSFFNVNANSVDFTENYPTGGSANTTVSGNGLTLSYKGNGNNFNTNDAILSSSMLQMLEGRESAFGPYKKSIVIRPGHIYNSDQYGVTAITQGKFSASKYTNDNGEFEYTYAELTNRGLDNGNNKIINVKAGEADTDGVNVSQLKGVTSMVVEQNKKLNKLGDVVNATVGQVNINVKDIAELKGKVGNTEQIVDNAKKYTDSKFNESNSYTDHKFNEVTKYMDGKIYDANAYTDQRIAKAGAANAALSGLKYLDYDANHKLSAAASFGQYKGATTGAVGLAYQPNEDVLVHLGTTVGSEHMLNGGVSIRVGDTTKGVKANTKNLAKEMDLIKAENAELKAELAEIKAMLANR